MNRTELVKEILRATGHKDNAPVNVIYKLIEIISNYEQTLKTMDDTNPDQEEAERPERPDEEGG